MPKVKVSTRSLICVIVVILFDLKSGYHHVDIHTDCWPYLGFSQVVQKVCRFYMFTVLPFGLSTARYVFTKF